MQKHPERSASAAAQPDAPARARVVAIGSYTIDLTSGELADSDATSVLQPSSLKVLLRLLEQPGEVVSSEALIEAAWPNRVIGDDAVHRRIADLRKHFGDDARNPRYVETLPRRGYRLVAPVGSARLKPERALNARRLVAFATVGALVVTFAGYVHLDYRADAERLAEIEKITKLVNDGASFETFLALRSLDDPERILDGLTSDLLRTGRLETDPPGAEVRMRRRDGEPWHFLGTTPLEADLPVGVFSIRLEKAGYASRTIFEANPGLAFNNTDEPPYRLRLLPDGATSGLIFVQGGEFPTPFIMTRETYALDDFLIDRFEVTNAEFKAFVDAGGYRNPDYWAQYEAFATQPPHRRFTDGTGETGPSGWEFGTYRTGTAEFPVTGVSWYEAQAYAVWAGRELPTAIDWARAALSPVEWQYPIAPMAIGLANIGGKSGLLPARHGGTASASGAQHLIGNAREWTSSTIGGRGVLIGGSFDSPRVQYAFPLPTDRFDRAGPNGFRLVTYLGTSNADLGTALDWELSGDVTYEPVSDETFQGIRALYTFERGTVAAPDARVAARRDEGDWERRVVEIPTIDPDDPLPVHLFIPKAAVPPHQPVVFVPPSDSFSATIATAHIDIADYYLDAIVRDGRVVVWPVFTGTHERFDGKWSQKDDAFLAHASRAHRLRRNELGRVIDYLDDDPEFDGSRIGIIARGWGATFAVHSMLALEERIQVAVLWNPLYPHGGKLVENPVINPATYWPRVRQPVLLTSGRDHPFANRQADPRLLLHMIGTPAEHKQLKVYDGPHWPLPRRKLLTDSIAWLDRYLGAPERIAGSE